MKKKLEIFIETLAFHLVIQLLFMAIMTSLFDAIDALNKTFYFGVIISVSLYFSLTRALKESKK